MTKTAFKNAIRKGDLTAVALAVSSGIDVNAPIENEDTPLHKAIITKNRELVQLLLSSGANCNALDSKRRATLDVATELGLSEICLTLRERGALSFKEMLKRRQDELRIQPWAASLKIDAIKKLAEDGIVDEQSFLNHNLSWHHANHVRKLQWKMKIDLGLLDPMEPLADAEILDRLRRSWLFLRNGTARYSFGSKASGNSGRIMCLAGGRVYYEDEKSIADGSKVYDTLKCQLMRKVDRAFGVYAKVDYDRIEFDLGKTRQVFGLDHDSLETLVFAYGRSFLGENMSDSERFHGYGTRVTCSDKENCCDLTCNYIPSEMPYITLRGVTSSHVSIAGLFDSLYFITEGFDPNCQATRMLEEGGVPSEVFELLRHRAHPFAPHVHFGDMHSYLPIW